MFFDVRWFFLFSFVTKQNKRTNNKTKETKRNKHKTKQNNTKQNKTKQTSKKTEMERREMEKACKEGNLEVVKNILSSHPESINFSDEVGNLFFFFFFIILQHLILNLVFVFHRVNEPPYILPVRMATRRLFQCCWPTMRMWNLRVR